MSENGLNLIPKTIDNAVNNITDKPTKSIGDTLSEIWYLTIGGPIHHAAIKKEARYALEAEKFKEELMQEINKIPEENLKEPDFQVASTALNDAKFCMENEDLRKMFANLIAAASDSRKANDALPIFSDIIRKMTSRDASNLASFGNVANHPIAIYRQWLNQYGYGDTMKNVFLQNKKYKDLRNQSISIDTLCSLGLVEVTYDKKFDASRYAEFYKTEDYKALEEICQEMNNPSKKQLSPEFQKILTGKARVEVIGGIVELTDLGSMFKRICAP